MRKEEEKKINACEMKILGALSKRVVIQMCPNCVLLCDVVVTKKKTFFSSFVPPQN